MKMRTRNIENSLEGVNSYFTYEEEWAIIVERKGWWDGTDRNKHQQAEEGSQG